MPNEKDGGVDLVLRRRSVKTTEQSGGIGFQLGGGTFFSASLPGRKIEIEEIYEKKSCCPCCVLL